MNQKIVTWLRSLAKEEKEIATIKIEIGERGNSTQVAILTYEDNPEELSREMANLATDAGWGHEHPKARFYAVTVDGKTARTKQITIPINGHTTTKLSDVHALMLENRKGQDALLSCIVEQARIQSSSLETLSESLAHREFALATVLETLIESERENAETSAANMILEHHLAEGTEPHAENPYQSAAAKVLDGLAKTFVPGQESTEATTPTDEQVSKWYKEDVWFKQAVDNAIRENTPPKDEHPIPNDETKTRERRIP